VDVSFLAPLYAERGPFATVTADATHNTESAQAELELRVRGLREELTGAGAPDSVAEAAVDRLLAAAGSGDGEEGPRRSPGRAVVATESGVLLDVALSDAPLRERADWAPLPDLLPVLQLLPGRLPHVLVVADRMGADVSSSVHAGDPGEEETIEGGDHHARKVPSGGWSQARFQNHAENVWQDNADKVASEVDRLVRRHGARLVVLAGEVRARAELRDQLGEAAAAALVEMEGGSRHAGSDADAVHARVNELVAEQLALRDRDVLERLAADRGRDRAVAGVPDVLDALRRAQVETLLISQRAADTTVVVGDDPLQLAVGESELSDLGADSATDVPADRALIRAAAGSGAQVLVLPAEALGDEGGVAALLRFVDDSTPVST
jgi:phosphoglycolate phosphatase-like HAD superfamily hydrolase